MDVLSGTKKSHAPIISYKCHNGTNQKFKYNKSTKQIKAKNSNKCLDTIGPLVVQNKCNKTIKSQKWRVKNKNIKSMKTNKFMDVMGANYNSGLIITYPCHNGPNQKFSK